LLSACSTLNRKKVRILAVKGESEVFDTIKNFCEQKKIKLLREKERKASRRSRELPAKGEEMLRRSQLSSKFLGDVVELANVEKNREEDVDSKSVWERFGNRGKSWKVDYDFGKKVEFAITGGEGLFLGYVGLDGKTFKILRVSDGKLCVTKRVKFKPSPKVTRWSKDLIKMLEVFKTEDKTSEAVGAPAGARSSRALLQRS
jgi:hypothetical protein